MEPENMAAPKANPGGSENAISSGSQTGRPGDRQHRVDRLEGRRSLRGRYQVVGLDVKRPKKERAGADWIECDVTEDESVIRSLVAVRERYSDSVASVIHLAAYYDFSGEPSPLYRTLTVEGTRRLLRALQPFKVEQFVFSSTLLVMKPVEEDEVITERSEIESAEETWDYPRSKIEAERVIRQEHGAIPTAILRSPECMMIIATRSRLPSKSPASTRRDWRVTFFRATPAMARRLFT